MNKKRDIIIGVIALLLVVSVGYAIFSDTLTINGTATAQGDFSFSVTTQKGVSEDVKSDSMYAIYNIFGNTGNMYDYTVNSFAEESTITNDSNTVTYSVALTQPGQKQYFTVKVTNTGSIPINVDIYNDFLQDTNITGNLIMDDGNLFDINKISDAVEGYDPGYEFTAVDIVNASALKLSLVSLDEVFASKNIYDELNDDPEAIPKLETGESLYFIFSCYWRPDISFNSHVVGFDVTATTKITVPIKQVTN